MNRLQSLLIAFIILSFPLRGLAIESEPADRYVEFPQLKWEDNRLYGKLRAVPVRALLEKLSSREGFQLEIIGEIDHTVDVFLDRMTLEQSIKKIMRLTNLDYIMILNGQGLTEGKGPHNIKKLIICNKDKKGLSTTKSPTEGPSPEKEIRSNEPTSPPVKAAIEDKKNLKKAQRNEDVQFEGSPEDLNDYVTELATEGRISPKEYEVIMDKIQVGN